MPGIFNCLVTHSNSRISDFRWGEHSDIEEFHEASSKSLTGFGVASVGNEGMLLNGVYQIFQLHTQSRGEFEKILVVGDHHKRQRKDHHDDVNRGG